MLCLRLGLVVLVALLVALAPPSARADGPPSRWTMATPDAWIALSERVAEREGPDALARVLTIASLAEQASAGRARAALERIGQRHTPLGREARWLARQLAPEPDLGWPGLDALAYAGPTLAGMVRTFALLGPFEDTGGGLDRAEGPEREGFDFRSADASWGAYEVRIRRTLFASTTPAGLPLDLYVHPRRESCTYLGTVVGVATAGPLVVRVAAAGTFRLLWDGFEVARGEADHDGLVLDRAAVEVAAAPGDHLLVVKSCTSAQPNDGNVRVRLAHPDGEPWDLETSSDLGRLQAALASARRLAGPPGHRRVATPLEQAIEVAQDTTTPQALSVATVLTLAQADDSQSPRAPGLLDRVASAEGVSPDELAMAGRLVRFGANRSGWLQRAWEQSADGRDDETRAFAQRELVSARLLAGQNELARATAAAAPLASTTDAHGRWLRATSLARLGGAGVTEAALRDLEQVAIATGPATPPAVWRTIAEYTRGGHPGKHLQALLRLRDQLPGQRGRAYLRAFRMLGAGTVERAALAALLDQRDARELGAIGELLLDVGKPDAARQAFALATRLSPNDAASHVGLARALAALAPAGGNAARIGQALARAKELDPQDARLGAEIAFREGHALAADEIGEDARYLVAPELLRDRAVRTPLPPSGVFERQLHWRRVVRLHPDKRVSQLVHYAREIVIEPRTENERYERIPFTGSTTQLLRARVLRRDGSIEDPEEQDAGGPMVRWPKLARGDIVEVAVRSWTAGSVGRRGDPPFFFVDYAGSVDTHPVLYNEVVVDRPPGSPLAFDVVGGKPDRTEEQDEQGRLVTRLIWDRPPAVADEPMAPPPSELVPVVVGSVYPSWQHFLDWYRGAVQGFTEPDEQVKRLARELTDGKRTREQRLEALFNFVADDIRYVNYTSGEWWLPNRPQHLLARRQGDCDDKAMLLISLLRAVGIEASEVLIQTRFTGQPRVMREAKIAVPLFDHGIIYLPNENGQGGRLLDATSPQSRIGALPAMDARAISLLVADGARPEGTAPSAAAEHGVDAHWVIEIGADGSAKLHAREEHAGDSAFFLRTNLQQADARAQWVETNLLSRWMSGVTLAPEVGFVAELPGGKASLEYRGTSDALGRREGDELVVAISPLSPITAQLAPLTTRTLPVVLPPTVAPSHHDMRIELVAPPSHRFADPPPDAGNDGGPFGRATLAFTRAPDGRKLTLLRTVAFEASRIEVGDYPAWRTWLRGIDRLMQRGVRLVRR